MPATCPPARALRVNHGHSPKIKDRRRSRQPQARTALCRLLLANGRGSARAGYRQAGPDLRTLTPHHPLAADSRGPAASGQAPPPAAAPGGPLRPHRRAPGQHRWHGSGHNRDRTNRGPAAHGLAPFSSRLPVQARSRKPAAGPSLPAYRRGQARAGAKGPPIPRPIDRTRADVLRKVQGITTTTKGHSDSAFHANPAPPGQPSQSRSVIAAAEPTSGRHRPLADGVLDTARDVLAILNAWRPTPGSPSRKSVASIIDPCPDK
jgi:hypothetical protein